VLKAFFGIIAAVIGVTFVVVSTIMVAQGLAELVSIAAGDRAWDGNLAVGGGVFLALALVAMGFITRQLRTACEPTVLKYESRHHAQREKFGADVTQRAAT
jgi:hypothetical protein